MSTEQPIAERVGREPDLPSLLALIESLPAAEAEKGFVYFARQGSTRRLKIGWALDPCKRLPALQTASPFPITILGTVRGGRSLEAQVHRVFARLHLRGEWFRASPVLLAFIDQYARGGKPDPASEPFATHRRRPAKPRRLRIVRYVSADGRRATRNTPGARRVVELTESWYAYVGGRRVPLGTTDEREAWDRLGRVLEEHATPPFRFSRPESDPCPDPPSPTG